MEIAVQGTSEIDKCVTEMRHCRKLAKSVMSSRGGEIWGTEKMIGNFFNGWHVKCTTGIKVQMAGRLQEPNKPFPGEGSTGWHGSVLLHLVHVQQGLRSSRPFTSCLARWTMPGARPPFKRLPQFTADKLDKGPVCRLPSQTAGLHTQTTTTVRAEHSLTSKPTSGARGLCAHPKMTAAAQAGLGRPHHLKALATHPSCSLPCSNVCTCWFSWFYYYFQLYDIWNSFGGHLLMCHCSLKDCCLWLCVLYLPSYRHCVCSMAMWQVHWQY